MKNTWEILGPFNTGVQELSGQIQVTSKMSSGFLSVTCEFSVIARHFSRSLPLLAISPQLGQTREVFHQCLSQMRKWSRLPDCGASLSTSRVRVKPPHKSFHTPQSRCSRPGNPSLPVSLHYRASLVAQWTRIHLPVQDTRAQSLVREDPTCLRATKPVHHSYWACFRAWELQLLSPRAATAEVRVP